ncbi:MAG: hypothetical protein IT379_23565 [Deltaproteobacteria bacterium]|nr:hypothetical protein [Deltaproteobacteria bacterium]
MDIPIMPLPLIPSSDAILTGRAVRASTWSDIGNVANYVLGAGSVLIPHHLLPSSLSTSIDIYRYRAKTRAVGVEREWFFTFDDVVGGAEGTYTIAVPAGGPAQTIIVPPGVRHVARITETVGAPASADTELTFSIAYPSGSGSKRIGVSCHEVPRATISQAEGAVDISALRPRGRIYTTAIAPVVARAADYEIGRRTALFQWAVPATRAGATITTFARASTSGTFASVLDLGVPILARARYRGETTRSLTARFYGWVSSASTLECRVTTSHSASTSSTVTTTSTAPTWLTAVTFTVDCEDLATIDGLQSSIFDFVTFQFRRSAGAGTVYIAGVSCWED